MLNYSPWKIEQKAFRPEQEAEIEEQMAFSNGYISQYAFFDEYYSGEQHLGTFIDVFHGKKAEPVEIPNPTAVSLRLGNERLDLNDWHVDEFYRCLHKGEARLERRFTATSPQRHQVEVLAERQLDRQQPNILEQTYTVTLRNYAGTASFISVIGDPRHAQQWLPLQMTIDEDTAYIWLKSSEQDLQICAAQQHNFFLNGVLQDERPIKIDKKQVLGFAYMRDVFPGDSFTIKKRVAIVDSRNRNKTELPAAALALLNAQKA